MRLTIFFLSIAGAVCAQSGIRVVFMADDMGAAQGIDAGTIRAYREGVVRATNVIVPGPWLLHAIRELKENPGLDVGVHLALTSEWEFVKWRPLTHSPALADENGYFFPMNGRNPNFPTGSSLFEAKPKIEDIERELRAQIEVARRLLPRMAFLTAHMGAAGSGPERRKVLDKLSAEYRMPVVPGDWAKPLGRVYRQTDTGEEKAAALAERLAAIGPGAWFMIDHAAIDNEETRAIGHLGYRGVAADRSANVAAWTSPVVKDVIRRRKIDLITWSDLFREKNPAKSQ